MEYKGKMLGGVVVIFWGIITIAVLLVHIILVIFGRNRLLFAKALLLSVIFWLTAWILWNYWFNNELRWEKSKKQRERLEWIDVIKSRVEKSLNDNNETFEWIADSLNFKVYVNDSVRYFVNADFKENGQIWISEKTNHFSAKNADLWRKKINYVLPLLSNSQLLRLSEILKSNSYCFLPRYGGYCVSYPCAGNFLLQTYDTARAEFETYIVEPYQSKKEN